MCVKMVRNTFIAISRQFFSTKLKGLHETRMVQAVQDTTSRKFHSFNSLFHRTTSIMESSATDSKEDHLTRTSKNSRDAGIHSVLVKEINVLSPTIKEVILVSENLPSPFTFKAGQWVDVFIPGVDTVGGFSMCSSPHEMTSCGQLRLAIKYSTHPPALWMHEQCQVGVKLKVRVGGDFYLNWEAEPKFKKVLFIAGGVGINPLCSMIHYAMNEKEIYKSAEIKMTLLYSAKTKDELIFKEAFDTYCKKSDYTVKYFVTDKSQPHKPISEQPEEDFQNRRISSSDLQRTVNCLTTSTKAPIHNSDNAGVEAFICGPPSMISEFTDELLALKITAIHFEKWW